MLFYVMGQNNNENKISVFITLLVTLAYYSFGEILIVGHNLKGM